MTNEAIARAIYHAYETKDHETAEALIAPRFSFTSPYDNGLDRDEYFRLCWAYGITNDSFEIVGLAEDGDRVWVTYVARRADGKGFSNTEVLTIRDEQITQVEVFFGWTVPHPVPAGEHRDPD